MDRARRHRFRRRYAGASIGSALLLWGCAFQPVRSPQASLPAAFEARSASAFDTQALDRWWLLFADSQLGDLIESALASAPDARRSLAVLSEARAVRTRALTAFDPQGDISASATLQHSAESGLGGLGAAAPGAATPLLAGKSTTYDLGFTPSWELDLFGRRAANRRTANADFVASLFDYEASRQSLAANVAANLFQARGLAVQLAQARDTARIAGDLAAIGNRRVAAGIGSRADAASLAADAATAEANRLSLEGQLAVSKRSLLVLIGRGTDPLDSLAITPWLEGVPALPSITPADLLVRRPDIRAAQARMQSAAGTLKLDELALFPTFNLLPGATATRVESPFGYASKLWSIGIGLTLPLLDRPRLLAEIHAQNARAEQAVIAYETAVQQAYGEAESRLTALAADQAQLSRLVEAESQSRAAFEAQRIGYRAGIVDQTTLLTSERTWRGNLGALSSLQTSTLLAAVDTFKALGGGWSPASPIQSASLGGRP